MLWKVRNKLWFRELRFRLPESWRLISVWDLETLLVTAHYNHDGDTRIMMYRHFKCCIFLQNLLIYRKTQKSPPQECYSLLQVETATKLKDEWISLLFMYAMEGAYYRCDNFNEQHPERTHIDHNIPRRDSVLIKPEVKSTSHDLQDIDVQPMTPGRQRDLACWKQS
jgi:hypothetical protein